MLWSQAGGDSTLRGESQQILREMTGEQMLLHVSVYHTFMGQYLKDEEVNPEEVTKLSDVT